MQRREQARVAVMIPASIVLPDGLTITCVIRDMSIGGARLSIARRHRLGLTFPLHIPSFTHPFPMRRVWQNGDYAGAMLDLPSDGETAGAAAFGPISPSPPAHRPPFAGR